MRPRLVEWFQIQYGLTVDLPGYLTMLCLAILTGCAVLLAYTRRQGLHERAVYTFLILSVPTLLIGGKVVYALQFPQLWSGGTDFWLGSGMAIYGGLIGLLCCGAAVFRYYRLPAGAYLDGLALALSAGLILGRLGCFLNGCNWGKVTDLPWGVQFPRGSHAFRQQAALELIPDKTWLSLPVHPTQLYESAFGVVLLGLGLSMLRGSRFPGQIFVTLLGLYAVFRFFLEYLRADHGHVLWAGGLMTFAQMVSLLLLVLTVSMSHIWRRHEIPASA